MRGTVLGDPFASGLSTPLDVRPHAVRVGSRLLLAPQVRELVCVGACAGAVLLTVARGAAKPPSRAAKELLKVIEQKVAATDPEAARFACVDAPQPMTGAQSAAVLRGGGAPVPLVELLERDVVAAPVRGGQGGASAFPQAPPQPASAAVPVGGLPAQAPLPAWPPGAWPQGWPWPTQNQPPLPPAAPFAVALYAPPQPFGDPQRQAEHERGTPDQPIWLEKADVLSQRTLARLSLLPTLQREWAKLLAAARELRATAAAARVAAVGRQRWRRLWGLRRAARRPCTVSCAAFSHQRQPWSVSTACARCALPRPPSMSSESESDSE